MLPFLSCAYSLSYISCPLVSPLLHQSIPVIFDHHSDQPSSHPSDHSSAPVLGPQVPGYLRCQLEREQLNRTIGDINVILETQGDPIPLFPSIFLLSSLLISKFDNYNNHNHHQHHYHHHLYHYDHYHHPHQSRKLKAIDSYASRA